MDRHHDLSDHLLTLIVFSVIDTVWLVKHRRVGFFEIAYGEPFRLGGVGAGQNAGQLDTDMRMTRGFATGINLQKNHSAGAVAWSVDIARPDTWADPAPGTEA